MATTSTGTNSGEINTAGRKTLRSGTRGYPCAVVSGPQGAASSAKRGTNNYPPCTLRRRKTAANMGAGLPPAPTPGVCFRQLPITRLVQGSRPYRLGTQALDAQGKVAGRLPRALGRSPCLGQAGVG